MAKKRDTHCFVPGCNSQYKTSKLSLFSVPKDEALLEKWKRLIPQSDKILTTKSVVCELHFQEDFINKNYVHVVNGETVAFSIGKPILKSDAIPTIFPNIPSYLSISLPRERKSDESTSSLEEDLIVEGSLSKSKYSKISITLNDLRNIKLPTKFWGVIMPPSKSYK